MHRTTPLIIIASFLLIGCVSDQGYLSAQDIKTKNTHRQYSTAEKIDNRREIKAAFQDYLKYTKKNDRNKITALKRLAEIELEIGNLFLEENDNPYADPDKNFHSLYISQLDKAAKLFNMVLRDYPGRRDNDDVLYQISRLHYLQNNHVQSTKTLRTLINKYPKSAHYNEALFRLAEDHYTNKKYQLAEHTYTQIINSDLRDEFFEKSLYKRGWSRLKAQHYNTAIDDFINTISHHEFGNVANLNKSESELFKEYFRAIGVSFSYIGDITVLNDYFKRHPYFKHIPHTYSVISDVYHKQERYIDATNVIKQFIKNYPESNDAPHAHLKMIKILQDGEFTNKVNDEIENLYLTYKPDSKYWLRKGTNINHTQSVQSSVRYYILLTSSYFHNKYQTSKNESDFLSAQLWYKRFLNHYNSHARRGNVYYLYAELLSEHNNYVDAVSYYELAAYDKDLVLNKNAAYATIVLTNRLYNSSEPDNKKVWLDKHLRYSFLFYQMYPGHEHADKTVIHAAELAYATKKYEKAIELAEITNETSNSQVLYDANMIKAPAYFKLGKHYDAETIYTEIINNTEFKPDNIKKLYDQLALSVYRQAESERDKGNVSLAAHHFLRIHTIASQSDIASTAMYDAIALFMSNNMWVDATSALEKFQALYPQHEKRNDATKKLSIAYMNSNQEIKAAHEFEKISNFEQEHNLKMSALWQAAEIYESKNHLTSAIRSFTNYADTYQKPFPQYIEAMHKLSQLHTRTGNENASTRWKLRILQSDKKSPASQKTGRTKLLASKTSISLARKTNNIFKSIKLVEPLRTNLGRKKQAMKKAVKLYGQASIYGFEDITTEATYAIAEIYNDFSKSLLESERPSNLNTDELEQYEILLEDQAFPFEEKAIEFFEANLAHTKDGIYNQWVQLCHARLKEIFPVRYQREEKSEVFVDVIH